jgi:hypothetical protein
MSETTIQLTIGNPGSAVINLQTGKGSTHYEVQFGEEFRTKYELGLVARGPNSISTTTATNLSGYIYGDGSSIAGATPASTLPTPNTLAIRDDKGKLRATDLDIEVKANEAISKGAVVFISGASGANKLISLAQANTESLSSKTIGVSMQALAKNESGFVVTEGDLAGLGMNLGHGHGVEEGDPIWLSPTTPGGMVFGVANKPAAPNHIVFIGYVLKINGNTLDEIYVKVQNGFELEELHNVSISSPINKQVLVFDSATGLWSNQIVPSKAISIGDPITFNGLLYGNGSIVQNIQVTSNASANHVAQRDSGGRINATQVRLYSDSNASFYTQINPSSASSSNVSFQFPLESGTIATNNTALMLSGVQTANGAKTFNGQIELTGQSATNGTSALTRQLADERYGTFSAINESVYQSTTTNFAQVVAITLQPGKYQIDAFLASTHIAAAGCKIRFATNQPIKVGITDNYGRPAAAAFSWPIIDDAYTNANVYAIRSDTGAVEYRRTITGIIEILTPNTTLSLDYAQQVATPASPSEARKRSHILARKIN